MKKRILALILGTALMATTIVGCGKTEEVKEESKTPSVESEESADSAGTIGFSVSTLNNPFFVTLTEGAEAAAQENGLEIITVDAGDDPAKQTSDIEDLISKRVSVIIINPVDSDAAAPAVQDAIDKGIQVIAVDRAVNGADVACQIASDNVEGARMATEYLLELVGDGAKVAELQGVPGASATVDRGEGFHKIADEKLDVVASQTANFNRAEGMSVMENILQANPDIVGVFAHNDEMALGAIEAIEGAGKDVKVVGFDSTDDAVVAVEEGRMVATVAQKPEMMGKTSVETAIKLMKGESVEKSIPVEVALVK